MKATKLVPCPKCKGAGTRRMQTAGAGGQPFEYDAYCGTCLGKKVVLAVALKEIKKAQKTPTKNTRKVCPGCKREIDTYWSQTDEVRKYCFHDDTNGIKCKNSGKRFQRS